MIKWAITGNIASGKSVIENILKKHGFSVFDTDKISHDVLNSSQKIKNVFIKDDIYTNGIINRKKLGNIVFSNPKKLKKLQDIIHPEVKNKIKSIFEENKNKKHIFVSVPLLFETGFNKLFDKIIFVSTPEHIRLERLIKRNNLTKEEALNRIKAQQSEEEKIELSDFVFYNNSSIEDLTKQVESFISNIC